MYPILFCIIGIFLLFDLLLLVLLHLLRHLLHHVLVTANSINALLQGSTFSLVILVIFIIGIIFRFGAMIFFFFCSIIVTAAAMTALFSVSTTVAAAATF